MKKAFICILCLLLLFPAAVPAETFRESPVLSGCTAAKKTAKEEIAAAKQRATDEVLVKDIQADVKASVFKEGTGTMTAEGGTEVYLTSLKNGECYCLRFTLKNVGNKKTGLTITGKLDGVFYSWDADTIGAGETKGFYVGDVPLGEGVHTFDLFVNSVPLSEARITISDKAPIAVGDIVTFGHYEQDNSTGNRKEAIEWQVLEVKNDGSCVMISRYGLDVKPYNSKYTNVTWETCTLRSWLNGEFLNTAFTAEERVKLVKTHNVNADDSSYGTKGGNATDDFVWLLSIDEATKFFSSDIARICKPTAYAYAKNDAYINDTGARWWWLRSPGHVQYYAAYVNSYGAVFSISGNVISSGGYVRPVVCARLY